MLYSLKADLFERVVVQNKDNKTRLFQRYNRLVFSVFIIVGLLAVIIAISRYYASVEEHQTHLQSQ